MAAEPARRRPHIASRGGFTGLVLASALILGGCLQQWGSMGGAQEQGSTGSATTVSPMSSAAEIRDGACYEDFALSTQAIDAKLANSIHDISVSSQISDESLRQDIILGLRFNANLQKRVAFDTLQACLR